MNSTRAGLGNKRTRASKGHHPPPHVYPPTGSSLNQQPRELRSHLSAPWKENNPTFGTLEKGMGPHIQYLGECIAPGKCTGLGRAGTWKSIPTPGRRHSLPWKAPSTHLPRNATLHKRYNQKNICVFIRKTFKVPERLFVE